METIARVFPVKSKKDLLALAKDIDAWSPDEKRQFNAYFGNGRERWYFQKIGGKPYVISVAEVERPAGYDDMAASDDEFTKWFRKRVKKLSGVSIKKTPKGPRSELVYEFKP